MINRSKFTSVSTYFGNRFKPFKSIARVSVRPAQKLGPQKLKVTDTRGLYRVLTFHFSFGQRFPVGRYGVDSIPEMELMVNYLLKKWN